MIGFRLICLNQSLCAEGDGITVIELKCSGLNLRVGGGVSFPQEWPAPVGGGMGVMSRRPWDLTHWILFCWFFVFPVASYLLTDYGIIQ